MGTLSIHDHINKLEAVVTYNPEVRTSVMGSIKSMLLKRGDKQPADRISIQILQKPVGSVKTVVIVEGSGSWLESISFADDPEVWWAIDDKRPDWGLPHGVMVLESDSSKRVDRALIQAKDFEGADAAKSKIEDSQRHDQGLRLLASKKRH